MTVQCPDCRNWGVCIWPNEPSIWCKCEVGQMRKQAAIEEIAAKRMRLETWKAKLRRQA